MNLKPRSEALKVAGWRLFDTGDYAEPATKGGGYVEVQDDGVFEIGYEPSQAMRDMASVDYFLITRVPAEVLRALLQNYDATREAGK